MCLIDQLIWNDNLSHVFLPFETETGFYHDE